MPACVCFSPEFDYQDYVSTPLGLDMTNQRYAEVSVKICRYCGTRWLHYLVEYEGFSGSGRWFRGVLAEQDQAAITPQNAAAYLEGLEWHFCGGSYFRSRGQRCTGKIQADL